MSYSDIAIVSILVLVSIAFLVWRVLRSIRKSKEGGCGCGCGCHPKLDNKTEVKK